LLAAERMLCNEVLNVSVYNPISTYVLNTIHIHNAPKSGIPLEYTESKLWLHREMLEKRHKDGSTLAQALICSTKLG